MAKDCKIKRDVYVVFNPATELWEVREMTPAEAFMLDLERFGAEVAVSNMNWPIIVTSDLDTDDDGEH